MCCGITDRARGSRDVGMELPYPGTADCCFAQEPVEEQGVSGNPPSCSPPPRTPSHSAGVGWDEEAPGF